MKSERKVTFKDGITFSHLDKRWTCDVTVNMENLPDSFHGVAQTIMCSMLPQNLRLPTDMAVDCGLIPPPKLEPESSAAIIVEQPSQGLKWLVVALIVGAAALFSLYIW